jgi:hypothetical protein
MTSPDLVLLVPIHFDALCVEHQHNVVPPMADFSQLPFFNGKRDINPSTPWLGEAIASSPFQDSMLDLAPGIHLHWALPDALCRANSERVLPAVPDRWLITRGVETAGRRQIDKQWIVESNYLYPEDLEQSAAPPRAITYPYPTNLKSAPGRQPFRYLGRAVSLTELEEARKGAEYLSEPLTALGYGQPSFAAFYPNCHSVFGFHDEHSVAPLREGLYYELLGWYSSADQDAFRALALSLSTAGPKITPEGYRAALKRFGWQAGPLEPGTSPVTLCHARLKMPGGPAMAALSRPLPPAVTIGNTTAEALSAYLAATSAPATKAKVEDQLEAVLLASTLDHRQVDLGAKFEEARHASGFSSAPPSYLWAIRPATPDADQAEADAWPDVAELLGQMNALQRRYDAAWDEIRSRRRQIASDWHKYMLCTYAPEAAGEERHEPDVVRLIIEEALPPLADLIESTGELRIAEKGPDAIVSAQGEAKGLALELILKSRQIRAKLIEHAVRWIPLRKSSDPAPKTPPELQPLFALQRVVAPRYFQPTEPVILLTGPAARADRYRTFEGELACSWMSVPSAIEANLEAIARHLTEKQAWNEYTWKGAPWHPFLLEWEIELRPVLHLGNQTARGVFEPDFVARNFTLKRGEADLSTLADAPALVREPNKYSGSSLLTPHGVRTYLAQLEHYLDGEREQSALDPSMRTRAPLPEETRTRLHEVMEMLRGGSFLAQTLSGFNNALLMNRQVLQLPIEDPLGFPEERDFADKVSRALGGPVYRSPQPMHGFSPLRTGELRISRLRLIDTFGQTLNIDCDRVVHHSAETLPLSKRDPLAVRVPPRIVQPARLYLRWGAAGESLEALESNSHPHTSPICGWVIANHLDQNLFCYDAEGVALGYLEVEGSAVRWRPMPNSASPVLILDEGIEDEELRKLVRSFLANEPEFFETFLLDLEAAQTRIEPEDAGDAVLMGRPLALVRATMALQLQGLPAIHQGWQELINDIHHEKRATSGLERVRFPVRLGDMDQLGDGVAIYWEDEDLSTYVIPFYEVDTNTDPKDRKCDFLYLRPDAAPLNVTMLVDPRGSVHASTGVLPVKEISIPTQYYQDVLPRLETCFLVAPMLVEHEEKVSIREGWLKVAQISLDQNKVGELLDD